MLIRTNPIDLYAVLGLAPDATQTEIRRAYRTLMRRHHPDTRSPQRADDRSTDTSTNTDLHDIVTAYHVLGDPARRAGYDRAQAAGARTTAGPRVQEGPGRAPSRGRSDAPIQAGPVRWRPS